MDSEHATRRRLSECLETAIHMSPIATLLFSSSSLVNSLIAGLFTEWDGRDPIVLNEATMKLLGTLTANKEPLFKSTSNGEMGFLLCKVALLMVKERDFYVAYALISSIERSLRDVVEHKDLEASSCKKRIVYYQTIAAFLSAFCYLEMDEYTICPYNLRHLSQMNCLLASIHFLEYLNYGPIQLDEFVQLLHVYLYIYLMYGHLDMLHECYIAVLCMHCLIIDLLLQLNLLSIFDSDQSTTNNNQYATVKVKYLHIQTGDSRSVFDEESIITITALLSDIEGALQGSSHSQDSDQCVKRQVLLNQARIDFVKSVRKLLYSYTPKSIADAISAVNNSPKDKQLYSVYGKYGAAIAQLYVGTTFLRCLIENSFGISTRLANATLIDKPSSKMCEHVFNLTEIFLQAYDRIPLHIGIASSLKPQQLIDEHIDKPKNEDIRVYLAILDQCSKGFTINLQTPPLLNSSMIKSICAIMCSALMLLLSPTESASESASASASATIQLGSVVDSLSMLSTHCSNDLLLTYTSLEILNAFIVSNCSPLLLHDILKSEYMYINPQSPICKDTTRLSMKRVTVGLTNNKNCHLNQVYDQVPRKSFCDDIDGWMDTIIDIIYTIPRQSISSTAELVSMLQRLCRREDLTILRLLCANDDRRIQIIKYLRFLWFVAQSYRDKVLCMHHRLQGYSYTSHTLPLIGNSFLQRRKSLFPLQNVLLDMYVITLEW